MEVKSCTDDENITDKNLVTYSCKRSLEDESLTSIKRISLDLSENLNEGINVGDAEFNSQYVETLREERQDLNSFDEKDIFDFPDDKTHYKKEGSSLSSVNVENQTCLNEKFDCKDDLDLQSVKEYVSNELYESPLDSILSESLTENSLSESLGTRKLSTSAYNTGTDSVASLSVSVCSEDSCKPSKAYKKKKKKRKSDKINIRPNYFVGIQISNPEIHKAIVDVQKTLLASNESLAGSLVDVATSHITLLVAHIASEEELNVACSALDHCGARLCESCSNPPIRLKFQGISNFSNQTVFAKVIEDEDYYKLIETAEIVRGVFGEKGVLMPDKKDLIPHLTIAKLSKVPRGKGKSGIRKIYPSAYEVHLPMKFGEQAVAGLQLLSMNKPKDKNRYYQCSRETLFDFRPNESSDHSQCCYPQKPIIPRFQKREFSTGYNHPSNESSIFLSSLRSPFSSLYSSPHFWTKALIGGAALVSLGFVLSKLIRKK